MIVYFRKRDTSDCLLKFILLLPVFFGFFLFCHQREQLTPETPFHKQSTRTHAHTHTLTDAHIHTFPIIREAKRPTPCEFRLSRVTGKHIFDRYIYDDNETELRSHSVLHLPSKCKLFVLCEHAIYFSYR